MTEDVKAPQTLKNEEFKKFLASTNDELERLMQENEDVLVRLKVGEW